MTQKNYNLEFETISVRGASGGDKTTGAISYPIYQSATFKHPELNKSTGYDYSRTSNPTREEVEKTLNLLEGGLGALAFSTGVAAITACIHLFKPGDHIIISEDLYGGTFRLFNDIYSIYGIKSSFIDTSDINKVKNEILENTKCIFIETPSNPLMRVSDISLISNICKNKNLILIVDNTFLTPYFQKPLLLGADIVVHSGTKFLGGHNDVLAGFIVSNNENILKKLKVIQNSTGATLSSFDSWLILRGLKTLHIRLEKSQENAIVLANYLKGNKNIEKVYYVGLEDHIGYKVNSLQSTGFGSMISFRVKNKDIISKILKELKVIAFAESLGGVETLITYPHTQTHSEIPKGLKDKLGVDENLLRISVGIENINDLIKDLERVLED
ncbi:cystathionine gamma-synthase [Clostridium sartagoforme AAU1]|uniref:Cystathionine gamma-synthase n=1 Tax=Clostridium sartagoforme AAU1 TaxID=1202534 RepID=R9C6K2_9CLOT|nr:PLP-dependent aspartate aminotransferase family protein [Clostridium sartagoforme]EOR24893.1 cystathionine gamma-synthase [Clostridium sartagoforme AAU1]